MSPRPDVSEERKTQILDAATKVFTKKGFQKARMDDIVKESGLSKGALYWYFKSKDDLIVGILDHMFQRQIEDLSTLIGQHNTATERLEYFFDQTIEEFKQFERFMPIMLDFVALAFRATAVQKAFKKFFRKYMAIVIPLIQQGVDSGEFRPVDAEEAAIAVGAILEGTILLWAYDSETVDVTRHMKSGSQIFLDGLQASPKENGS